MTDSQTRISDLGFDSIKENLKEFYKTQDHWKDYDFEASGLNLLLDQLAYTTHYNTFYANMLSAEMFLDSAETRSSVVSHAKSLSYTPKSITASKMSVDITVEEGVGGALPTSLTLPKGSKFNIKSADGTNDSAKGLKFITDKAYTSTLANNKHVFEDVILYQGAYKSVDFIVNKDDIDQRFILPHDKIDMALIEVYVQEGTDDTKLEKYVFADNIIELNGESKIYFTEETEDARFRLVFGNGVLGKELKDGKIIRVVYFETQGAIANGVSKLEFIRETNNVANSSLSNASVSISINTKSYNGSDAETVDSIKFRAPKNFLTRDRAVTADDWKFIILDKFHDIKSVKVWGGEDEDIAFGHYGKVYLSVNAEENAILTKNRKKDIVEYLKNNHRILGITPEIIDPEIIWLILDVKVTVSSTEVFVDPDTLKNKIQSNVDLYSSQNMLQFDHDFEHSRVTRMIDETDNGILNNLLNVEIEHRLRPFIGKESAYKVLFRNPIKKQSIISNRITWQNQIVQFEDDGNGKIHLFKINDDIKTIVLKNAGTVNYDNGEININPVYIQKADSNTFDLRIRATPVNLNVYARRNKILKIDSDIFKVDIVSDNTTNRKTSKGF